jgi:hypothetical protein
VRRAGLVLAGFALAASLFTACSAAKSDVGTSNESCYQALPAATKAVGSHAHLAGIRKFSLGDLHSVAPRLYGAIADDLSPHQSLCVAGFTGHFTASMVSKPLGQPSGIVAVAVLTSPDNRLLGTLVLNHVPVQFSHLF